MSTEINLNEFVNEGYLLESNRQFFHPLGLELSIDFDEEGIGRVSIIDYRHLKKGPVYVDLSTEDVLNKHYNMTKIIRKRFSKRIQKLNFLVQPIVLPEYNTIPVEYREVVNNLKKSPDKC